MNKIIAALILTAADVWIMARYPIAPSADDLASTLLGGVGIFTLFGFLCVIFAERLCEFTGPLGRGGAVDNPTPSGCFVFFGFLLLLVPIVAVCFRVITA